MRPRSRDPALPDGAINKRKKRELVLTQVLTRAKPVTQKNLQTCAPGAEKRQRKTLVRRFFPFRLGREIELVQGLDHARGDVARM